MTSPRKKVQQPEAKAAKVTNKLSTDRKNEPGVPYEHYHGENTDRRVIGSGDLEEETLDQSAPFNKTYGIARR